MTDAPTGTRQIMPPITHHAALLSKTQAPVAKVARPTRPAMTMTPTTSVASRWIVALIPFDAVVAMRSMSVTGSSVPRRSGVIAGDRCDT